MEGYCTKCNKKVESGTEGAIFCCFSKEFFCRDCIPACINYVDVTTEGVCNVCEEDE